MASITRFLCPTMNVIFQISIGSTSHPKANQARHFAWFARSRGLIGQNAGIPRSQRGTSFVGSGQVYPQPLLGTQVSSWVLVTLPRTRPLKRRLSSISSPVISDVLQKEELSKMTPGSSALDDNALMKRLDSPESITAEFTTVNSLFPSKSTQTPHSVDVVIVEQEIVALTTILSPFPFVSRRSIHCSVPQDSHTARFNS